jgi:hypothetical protein
MGEPCVVNGVPITMTLGLSTKSSAFSLGSTKVTAGGLAVVKLTSLLGGLSFTSSLNTTKTKVEGGFIPLVGATVTDADGYTGVITVAQGAGIKYSTA